MEEQKSFCPECELRKLQSEATKEKIEEIVSKMAYTEGVTTPEAEYKRRLQICSECPSLKAEILCAECGSYVAFRAHNSSGKCPFPGKNKWEIL